MGSSAAVGKASRLTLFRKLPSGQRNNPKEKRQLQPGSTPTSNISQPRQAGSLSYTTPSPRHGGYEKGAFRCTRIIARHSGEQCRIGFQPVSGLKYSMSAPFSNRALSSGLKPWDSALAKEQHPVHLNFSASREKAAPAWKHADIEYFSPDRLEAYPTLRRRLVTVGTRRVLSGAL